MKKGFFLINAFYKSKSVDEIYVYLKEAAERAGASLDLLDNSQIENRVDINVCTLAADYDFCIFWNKDILLARMLERNGIRVFNSADAIEVCDHKAKTHMALIGNIAMPQTYFLPFTYEGTGYTHFEFLDSYEKKLGYPYVMKECLGSLGSGVYMASDRQQAENILRNCNGADMLAQEFIKPVCEGEYSDIRVYMAKDRCIAAMERYSSDDFRTNVGNGGMVRKYTPTEEELHICRSVMEILGLDFSGVDILHGKLGPLVCEVNSNAQFNALREIADVKVEDAIIECVLEQI